MRAEIKAEVREFARAKPFCGLVLTRVYSLLAGLLARCVRFFRFPKTFIAFDARLVGLKRIRLGDNVVIGSASWLNVNDRSPAKIALEIGSNTFIGQRNFFSVGKSIILRDYCLTAASCAFIGSSHRFDNPMKGYITTGVTLDADIYVGANCFFGYGAQVIGNVRVGHGSVIGAGAVIRQDIPPFSLVVGNPGKVIKRFDFATQQWVKWPCDPIEEGPNEDAYIESLRRQHAFIIQPLSVAVTLFGDLL